MACLLLQLCLLLSVLASATAEAPKVVQMQTFRHSREVAPKTLLKRANPFEVTLGNTPTIGLYYVNASVGTPPQEISLLIDTGSSDVWMFGPQSCNSSTSPCLGGNFDPQSSSSSRILSEGTFNIQYVTPGSTVTGSYIADDFSMGGIIISRLIMAVATSALYVPTGIMGIGFSAGESIVQYEGTEPYPNIIDELVSQGLINTRAYSLWLNDLDSNTGTILFGGYDTAKFHPPLIALPIQPDSQSGTITSMTLAWTSLSLTAPTTGTDPGTIPLTPAAFAAPAILDSGTTLTGLPTALYTPLAAFFDAVDDANYGTLVACNISATPGTLNYGFGGPGGPVIRVPFYELAIPALDARGDPVTFRDGSAACVFGLFPVADGQAILFGDTFLRSAYVVYDLARREIAIAPTVFNTSASNVVAIPGTGSGFGVRSVAEGVSALQTGTGVGAPGIARTATAMVAGAGASLGLGVVGAVGSTSPTANAATSSAVGMEAVLACGGAVVWMLVGGLGTVMVGEGMFFLGL